jgi:hypothetical protein
MIRRISFVIFSVVLLIGLTMVPVQAATPDAIQASIDAGVPWLAAQQYGDGSWEDAVAQTGFAVVKLEDRAIELGYDSPFDEAYPYHQNVIDGLNFIFQQASASCNGIVFAGGYHETYSTGIAMMAIAGSKDPGRIVSAGSFAGMTYLALLQENVDYFACAQNPDGGWRYSFTNEPSDNSNTGYAVLGLRYAEAFGVTIPQTLKDNLSVFIDAIQDDVNGDANDGGSDYTVGSGWFNVLKTGNLLFEMAFVGDTTADQRVQDAIDYIERHWNDPNSDPGWQWHLQSMYCMMKGFEALGIVEIQVDGNPVNWFDAFTDMIIAAQQGNGSWPGDNWGGQILATEWALLTLEKVAPPPVEIKVPVDIKPTSCRNPINVKDKGVLPVAILGTEDFDVTQIDPATVLLGNVSPLRWSYKDVATPFEPYIGKINAFDCTTAGPDGYLDLVLHFDIRAVVADLGNVVNGDVLVLKLTGNLSADFENTPIIGEDVVVIVKKGK